MINLFLYPHTLFWINQKLNLKQISWDKVSQTIYKLYIFRKKLLYLFFNHPKDPLNQKVGRQSWHSQGWAWEEAPSPDKVAAGGQWVLAHHIILNHVISYYVMYWKWVLFFQLSIVSLHCVPYPFPFFRPSGGRACRGCRVRPSLFDLFGFWRWCSD